MRPLRPGIQQQLLPPLRRPRRPSRASRRAAHRALLQLRRAAGKRRLPFVRRNVWPARPARCPKTVSRRFPRKEVDALVGLSGNLHDHGGVAKATSAAVVPGYLKTLLDLFYLYFSVGACTWLFRRARQPEKPDTRQRWMILGAALLWMLGGVAAACIWGEPGAVVSILPMLCTPLLYTLLRKWFDPSYGKDSPCFWRRWLRKRKERQAQQEQAQREAQQQRIAYNRAHGIRMCPYCHSAKIVFQGHARHTEWIHFYGRQGHSRGTVRVQDPEKRWRCQACRSRWEE